MKKNRSRKSRGTVPLRGGGQGWIGGHTLLRQATVTS